MKSRNDPKSFWKTIKQSTKSSHKRISTDSIQGDKWYIYFKKLLNSPSDHTEQVDNNILENIRQENDCEILNRPITELEVRESVFSLPSNKSPGPDGICSELYKVTLDYICPFLCKLFNELLDKGEAPQCFGESIISPIHKNGPIDDPGNFRGISLINNLCKTFMGIMNKRLQTWCDEYKVIDESQAGFRKLYSTADNIFCLHAVASKYLTKPTGRFYCLFIDFAKAFDSVEHEKLWDALFRKGIGGNFLLVMKSLYSNLKSCIKTSKGLTDYFHCTLGTRKGCKCSPIFFSIFIND